MLGNATVNTRGGITISAPVNNSLASGSLTDANNNTINTTYSAGPPATTTFADTLDSGLSHVLTVSGNPPTPPNCSSQSVTYSYLAPNNQTVSVTVSYAQYTVQTNFQIPNTIEYGGPNGQATCLVNRVTLPDGTYYQLGYEATVGMSGKVTGRLTSVTLPAGGQVTYSYGSNANYMMSDGSPWYMQRSYGGGTWNYWRAVQLGKPSTQTTTQFLDPGSNETDMNFSGIYVTSAKYYTGDTIWGQSRTLLKDTFFCYNGNFSNCATAVVNPPATGQGWGKWFYDYLTDQGLYKTSVSNFDQYGNLTGEADYPYTTSGSPTPIHGMALTYNSSLCGAPTYICDRPSSMQVNDGQGHQYALTNYSYYGKGNLKQVDRWVSGSNVLSTYYNYNGNGTLASVTDPKGTQTTYSYDGTCNGAFPTSVSVAGLPATQYQYNCSGGVVTSITDPNGAQASTTYNDAYFWRPAYVQDPLGNKTAFTYYTNAYGSGYPGVESVLTSNSNTVAHNLGVTDAFGRVSLQQTYNPDLGTWDTVEYLYDSNGRVSYSTLPFSDSAGHTAGGLPSTGYFYDALNRYTEIATFDGVNRLAYTDYLYNQNDVKVTFSPASMRSPYPTSRQYEYDALGRLTSVCELSSSGVGVSACGQSSPPGNGYTTTYSYDPLGDLMSVNQSGQTRSFTYDGLGRMLTESNPESGTTTYTYDTVGGSYCAATGSYTSLGDLVATADASGNHACYWYDSLHRITDVGNNHQSSTSPCLRYRYDGWSPPQGIGPQYYYGRMVEAETDNCAGLTLTDEWFSYSARGEATDAWESTPNSGGWYHTANSYAANGPVSSRVGYKGTGTNTPFSNAFAYSFNAEGRPNGSTDMTIGKALWSGTTYNPAGQPNQVQFYSGDSESFTWDWLGIGQMNNPGSMLSWTSTVGTGPNNKQTGTLTWNKNGTLQQLAINDLLNSGGTQTCNYSYDDLSRLANVDCGTAWSQTFSYLDAFGNIKKSGNSSFLANYNGNNQITNFGYVYDADGNITYDGSNNYSYNVYGRPAAVTGLATGVYDALQRLVEVQTTSGNTQLVYAPDGFKFAYMNGQTVHKYVVPLAAGLQAVYTGATPAAPAYWRHADWLGSVRMASKPDQTFFGDQAYGPFGESYASFGTGLTEFTGQNKDLTSVIYDFPLRQYSQIQSRWMVPDPAGLAAVDISNPQTWNRYAYLANNPLNAIDPKGLSDCDSYTDKDCNGGGGAAGGPDPINYFFGGAFSGTWGQNDWNNWESQQFFQSQNVYQYLPSQQNPKSQSAYWEAQYEGEVALSLLHIGYTHSVPNCNGALQDIAVTANYQYGTRYQVTSLSGTTTVVSPPDYSSSSTPVLFEGLSNPSGQGNGMSSPNTLYQSVYFFSSRGAPYLFQFDLDIGTSIGSLNPLGFNTYSKITLPVTQIALVDCGNASTN